VRLDSENMQPKIGWSGLCERYGVHCLWHWNAIQKNLNIETLLLMAVLSVAIMRR